MITSSIFKEMSKTTQVGSQGQTFEQMDLLIPNASSGSRRVTSHKL